MAVERTDSTGISETLVSEIVQEHEAAQTAFRSAVGHAIRCGELLTEAKAQVRHGEWLPWLEVNFEFRRETAAGYMRLAAKCGEDPTFAPRSIAAGLKAIAATSETTTGAKDDPPPQRADFEDDHLGGAKYHLAYSDWHRDGQDRRCGQIVAAGSEMLAKGVEPMVAAATIAEAAAMIAFHASERAAEAADDDEWWVAHEAAGRVLGALREAQWAADDVFERPRKPLFHPDADGRPNFDDCYYLAHQGLWPKDDPRPEPSVERLDAAASIALLRRLLDRQRREADRYPVPKRAEASGEATS